MQALRMRGGADFRYKYIGHNNAIRKYLRRLEIGIQNKHYSCFIYALLTAGVDEELCKKMNVRCKGRYLSIKNVQAIINEFELNVQVRYWYSTQNQDIVIKAKHPDNIIEIMCYEQHYFIHEPSPFTDQQLGWHLRFKSLEPLQLTSSRLLYELMNHNELTPLLIRELPLDIKPITSYTLDYNPKQTLIRNKQPKPCNITFAFIYKYPPHMKTNAINLAWYQFSSKY
jgi:hypothetical protein